MIHAAENSLGEYGDQIPAEDKTAIETAVTELRDVIEGDDLEAINTKTEALSQASMKLGEAMYKAQQEEAEAAQATGGADDAGAKSKKDDDDTVVDADFEEVDPDQDKK